MGLDYKKLKIDWEQGTRHYFAYREENYEDIIWGEMEDGVFQLKTVSISTAEDIVNITDEFKKELLKDFKEVVKQYDDCVFIAMTKGVAKKFDIDFLKRYGYHTLDQHVMETAKFLGYRLPSKGIVKDLSGKVDEWVDKRNFIKKTIEEELSGFERRVAFNFEMKEVQIMVHYLKSRYDIMLSKEGMMYKDTLYTYENNEQLKKALVTICDKIKKANRLKVLYDPPKENLRKLLSHRYGYENIETIHSFLMKYLSPEEIERLAREQYEFYSYPYDIKEKKIGKHALVSLFGFVLVEGQFREPKRLFLEQEKEEISTYINGLINEEIETFFRG